MATLNTKAKEVFLIIKCILISQTALHHPGHHFSVNILIKDGIYIHHLVVYAPSKVGGLNSRY